VLFSGTQPPGTASLNRTSVSVFPYFLVQSINFIDERVKTTTDIVTFIGETFELLANSCALQSLIHYS